MDEHIIVKGPYKEAMLETIKQTLTTFRADVEEHGAIPSCSCRMYVNDVTFLLDLIKEK